MASERNVNLGPRHAITGLRERLKAGTAVDTTLSEVDNPRLFHLQVLGFISTGVFGIVGIVAAIVAAVRELLASR